MSALKATVFLLMMFLVVLNLCQCKSSAFRSWDEFETLNEIEKNYQRFYASSDSSFSIRLKSGNSKSLNTNQGELPIHDVLDNKQRKFVDNRYRAVLYYVYNNEQDSILKSSSSPCTCLIDNDSTFIIFEPELFEGESIQLQFYKGQLRKVNYNEYHHKMEAFPVDSVFRNSLSEMKFDLDDYKVEFRSKVEWEKGNHLNGYIKFNTPKYRINAKFLTGQATNNLLVYRTGEVLFKCQLKNRITLIE